MQALTWILAVVVAAAAAGCSSSSYDYGPNFDRLVGSQPGYGYTSAYLLQWDDYRNYRGAVKPALERP